MHLRHVSELCPTVNINEKECERIHIMNYVSPDFSTLSYGASDRMQIPLAAIVGFPIIPALLVAVWVAAVTMTAFVVGTYLNVSLYANVLSIMWGSHGE